MSKNNNRSSGLAKAVVGLWSLVILIGAVVGYLAYRIYLAPPPAAAAGSESQAGVQPPMPTGTSGQALESAETQLPVTPADTPEGIATEAPADTPAGPTATFALTPLDYFEGPIEIGYSAEGRPLEVFRFGTGPRRFMIVAGIHGGYEVNTIQLADELIAHLRTRPNLIPDNATLYILRALNPDGETKQHKKEGRANANGVDLNRSFPVAWEPTWDREGCWDLLELTAGDHPASEPESIAIMAFVLEHPLVAMVSYHSAAPGFYPAEDPNPDDPISIELSRFLSKASGYPYPAYYTGCFMTGSMVDWVAATGTAAVDLELSNHWDTDFEMNLALVKALVTWVPGE